MTLYLGNAQVTYSTRILRGCPYNITLNSLDWSVVLVQPVPKKATSSTQQERSETEVKIENDRSNWNLGNLTPHCVAVR